MATKKTKTKAPEPELKMSLMKAAIKILGETEEAMNTKRIVETAKEKGYWTPSGGRTPEQTLYSAIVRDIKAKGEAARFKMVTKGHFALAKARG